MKRIAIQLSVLFFCMYCGSAQVRPHTFKVMAWNILHGGNDLDNGVQNVIDIIGEIDPDVVLMVETYGSGKRIADALGYNFHLIAPEGTAMDDKGINLSVFSKYPFGERIDTPFPFYLGGREILVNGYKLRVFSNWFHYLPWEDEPEKLGMSVAGLLAWERTGNKYEMIQKVLPYIQEYAVQTDSVPMIFGGDMNSPSHLDWGENTKELHNGLIVPWYATKILEDQGLIDSYRALNPDPLADPGITWHTKGKNDDHRIDYIFYKGTKIRAVRSESYRAFFGEPFSINGKTINYPSDHGFVLTTFEIAPQ